MVSPKLSGPSGSTARAQICRYPFNLQSLARIHRIIRTGPNLIGCRILGITRPFDTATISSWARVGKEKYGSDQIISSHDRSGLKFGPAGSPVMPCMVSLSTVPSIHTTIVWTRTKLHPSSTLPALVLDMCHYSLDPVVCKLAHNVDAGNIGGLHISRFIVE